MSKLTKVLFMLTIAYIMLYGCSSDRKSSDRDTVVFTDAMQRQVKVPKSVNRIISMAPNVTEMLFAIGLDEKIVGVTTFCNYPEGALNKTKIGGYYDPNIEVILSLAPDLIVATPDGHSKERVEKLDQAGTPVFIVYPQNKEDVLKSMLMLGEITGKERNAQKVIAELRSRIKAVMDKVSEIPVEKRPKVFYEIGHDPLITVGPDNFVDDLISTAGGINIAGDAPTGWPRYSVEAVIMKDPDVIITAPDHVESSEENTESRIDLWKRYRTISAVKNGRIYQVNPDILLRPGPRIAEGIETLYKIFHQQ